MQVDLKVYLPDGTTPRETYSETIGTKNEDQMTLRNLEFVISSGGGFAEISFDIFENRTTVTTRKGDIVKLEVDSVVVYYGKLTDENPSQNDTGEIYEDLTSFIGKGRLLFADNLVYSLREGDGDTVSTNIQTLLNDLFEGGQYSGKGQDNNQPIESALTLLSYAQANNTMPSLNIDVAYNNAPAYQVMRDVVGLANGTVDLTANEKYIYYLKTDENIYTKQRSSSVLQTFVLADNEFPVKNSVDIADDGFSWEIDTEGIFNKFILNGAELTSLQYATEVASSRSTHDTRTAPPLDNPSITITQAQKWLDGFILEMLEPTTLYTIKLDKATYGLNPVFFSGGTDVPDGYIKVTKGAATIINSPFLEARYSLDSGGWDIEIKCGEIRPNLDVRSKILTEFTGIGSLTLSGSIRVYDPSDTHDETTVTVPEFQDDIEFAYDYYNNKYPIDETNVKFIMRYGGGDFWSGGAIVHTFTSATTPNVRQEGNTFKLTTYRGEGTGSKVVNGNTVYEMELPAGESVGTNYTMEMEITIPISGVDYVQTVEKTPFRVVSQTVTAKADDSQDRLPTAEKLITQDYDTPTKTATVQFYDNIVDTPPDAGTAGWFITNDDSGSWVRMTGDFAGNITGTTNDSFEINSDDTSETKVYLVFNVNSGSDKAAFEFDYNGGTPRLRFAVDFDEGTPASSTWTDLASGAADEISRTVTGDLYKLEIDASGDLIFNDDSPYQYWKYDTTVEKLTLSGSIIPTDNGVRSVGDDTHTYGDVYGDIIHTDDINEAGDNWRIEWDGTNTIAIPHNMAMGFMDD
jgi:hypothetical protein